MSLDDQSTVDSPRGGATGPSQIFAGGEILAGRFRIVSFPARGGMGEVYEAEDLELRERVALKTVRRDIGSDESSLERFRRQIQLARKVTHPNVCRIFDVFHHSPKGTVVTFLTMEFLDGITLLQHLRRTGPMKTDQVLPIVKQTADALNAAHKAGVIHHVYAVPHTHVQLGIAENFAAAGEKDQAEVSLEAIVDETERKEFVPLAFEARLALAELKKEQGDIKSSGELLTTLKQRATARGFLLIAAKAACCRA